MKKPFFESRFWKIIVFVLPIFIKKAPFVKTEKDIKIIDDVSDILKP
jgi:hypothetical protein